MTSDRPLTQREKECVALAGYRLSNGEIAQTLNITIKVVAKHLYSAYGKLGVRDRIGAARRLGILYPDYTLPSALVPMDVPSRRASTAAHPAEDSGTMRDRLFGLYVSLGDRRQPRPIGGTLLPTILGWTVLGLVILVVIAGLASAVFGSGNAAAERHYETAQQDRDSRS